MQKLHDWMNRELEKHGAHINAFYYCPHHPEGIILEYSKPCECRKPAPGMIIKALAEWPIDKNRSLLIGDKDSDIAAASAAKMSLTTRRPRKAILRSDNQSLQNRTHRKGVMQCREVYDLVSCVT